jgi:hypothetical protein
MNSGQAPPNVNVLAIPAAQANPAAVGAPLKPFSGDV